MNTWFDHWDRHYIDRVWLLVEILPVLAHEPSFALKGVTRLVASRYDLLRIDGRASI
jgi:hypothetical protein